MESGQLIVAMDFGTTTFRTAVAKYISDGQIEIIGAGVEPASGFRDGDFVDVGAGGRAVTRCLKQAEAQANVYVSGFYYNVSGSHLRSFDARSQLRLEPGRRLITQDDIDNVMARTHSISIPFDHSILVANPVGFTVDGIGSISNPCDRKGSHLEVEAHLITGSRSIIGNIENTISKAGYEAVGWCIDILASSSVLLSAEEKQRGVLFVDIGGAHTEWIIYRDGKLAGCGLVPYGGQHLSSDLAHGLRVPLQTAEEIKLDRGLVLRSSEDNIDPGVLFEDGDPEETPGLIAAILEPRMEEILSCVKIDMGENLLNGHLGHGLVISGGGGLCAGTVELGEEVFGVAAEYRDHRSLSHAVRGLPAAGNWSTCLGLIQWAIGDGDLEEATEGGHQKTKGLKRFLGNLFS